ncbi:MAG: ankyrin repeat domain-containing protein [Candidatus Babeliales bacterium]
MQKILTDQNKSLGDTPLMIAIRNKDIRSVKRLLPLSDLTLINAEGNTYLMLAAQFYEEDIYNLILQ